MKTLLVTADFPPILGGISTVFYNIWKYLPADDFLVLAPSGRGAGVWDEFSGRKVYRRYLPIGDNIFKKLARTLLLAVYCWKITREENVKYLLCGQPVIPGIVGIFLKKLRKIPFQVWVYGGEVVKFKQGKIIFGILLKVLREADTVVVNSDFTKGVYVKLGIPEEKIIKITPAVDTAVFKPGIDTRKLAIEYNLAGKRVLLTVARLSRRKGHDTVIRALSRLKEEFPDLVYLIVGSGPDEKRLRALAAEYGVNERVIFCGAVADEELPGYYNLCDIHVMPNRQAKGADTLEGFGLSFIEASACAKPVIGGRSGGSNEAVAEGITGFLVDPFSVEELADKIKILLTDGDISRKMSHAGRKRSSEDFQWKDRAGIIEKLFS